MGVGFRVLPRNSLERVGTGQETERGSGEEARRMVDTTPSNSTPRVGNSEKQQQDKGRISNSITYYDQVSNNTE